MSTADRNLTGLRRRWGPSPSTLAPGCFASVMATGIVSVGAELKGLPTLSVGLFSIGDSSLLEATRVLVGASSALLWAIATWLVPALVAAGAWRHAVHRVPMTYSAGLWSMVFPVGMYAVASIYLGRSDHVPAIEWIGLHWYWIALTVWSIVFVTMVTSFVRALRSR